MGSFYGSTSEIVEVLEEVGCVRNGKKTNQNVVHNKEQKPQLLKLGYDITLEDDINKLFESISLKVSSKNSPDQTTTGISKKNALKKPMRAGGHSPGIGFSEPVSLKQALRRQCISQASEMAAIKRLTNPIGSPRISEAGMITSMYRSVVVESGESSGSANRFSRDEEEISSPGFSLEKNGKGIKSMLDNIKPVDESIVTQQTTKEHTQTTKGKFEKSDPSGEIVSEKENESVVPQLEQKKALPRSRRKGRLQIAANSSNTIRGGKSLRKVSPTFKSVPRNRSIVKKNLKLTSVPTDDDNIKIQSPMENNSSQLLCQRCHCTMTHESTESSTGDIGFSSNAASSYGKGRTIVEMEKKSRTEEKGDFSQSSNSSLGDYSTSTSNSEESNASGSICGNRPHMAKDSKWEAIQQAKKHSGGLGLAHFSLLKKLGSGDIGTVYLAELVGTNCLFAIKVMDNEFLARRKKITRAQTERDILRMLDHPFLPTLYGQFTSDNLSCLIMEYCPGGDLHVLRQRQPGRFFPEQAARFYVAEVLLALEYLHMLGVIYRDLKPENIMVREDGHIMLTDFDLSLRCDVNPTLLKSSSLINEPPKISGPCTGSNCIDPFCAEPTCQVSCFSPRLLPPSTKQRKKAKPDLPTRFRSLPQLVAEPTDARSNSFVGTHEYLAPEIIKGEGHGSAVDWWTFGVFLFELLYGRTPFKGSGNEETLANVVLLGLRFPDSPLVSFQARDLIRGLLVKEPENRLGSQRGAAEIKQHAFFDGLNWALIRCAVPPQVPEFFEVDQEMEIKYLEFGDDGGDQLEFELF